MPPPFPHAPLAERTSAASSAALTYRFNDLSPWLPGIAVDVKRSTTLTKIVQIRRCMSILGHGQTVPKLFCELNTLVGRQVAEVQDGR
jgi:hypothetical protein